MGLTVAFDASALAKRERTGIARYGVCLIDALLRSGALSRCVLGYRLSRWRRHRHRFRPAGARVRYFTDAWPAALLGRFDVFHGLDARLPRAPRFPTVVTLHDVEQLARPEIADAAFRRRKLDHLQRAADHAHRIICVSAASREAFAARFAVAPQRLIVIHHGLEPRFRRPPAQEVERVLARLRLAHPYVLFVGLLSARKNVARLVAAFDQAAPLMPDVQLVLAGGEGHGADEITAAIARAHTRDRIVRLGYAADDDLPSLYAGARAFVFPGLSEGFGMPLLEAMACGTPVLAADRPVSREIAGDAALLVDATDPDRLADGLVRLVGADDVAREERILRGTRHAAAFTWDAAARRTLDVYHDVIERPGRSIECQPPPSVH